MSLPRVDVRTKVTVEAHDALEAEAEARGIDMAEVIRQQLEAWAAQRLHFATVLTAKRRREGREGSHGA